MIAPARLRALKRVPRRKAGASKHEGWEARTPRVDTSQHVGLVHRIARGFRDRPGIDFDERISLGAQALEKAARIFEPERGAKFSTMASFWIWEAIHRAYVLDAREAKRPHLSQIVGISDSRWAGIEAPGSATQDVEDAELAAWLWAHVDALPPRLALIVRARAHGATLEEVGREVGLTRSRVGQLAERGLRMLRRGRIREAG